MASPYANKSRGRCRGSWLWSKATGAHAGRWSTRRDAFLGKSSFCRKKQAFIMEKLISLRKKPVFLRKKLVFLKKKLVFLKENVLSAYAYA